MPIPRKLNPNEDFLLFNDPMIRQTFIYATPIVCDNKPQNVNVLDPDNNEQQIVSP